MKRILIKRSVVDSLLSYAKACHPKEGILLLRGKVKRDLIEVNEVEIPPLSVRGKGFSTFPTYMLPIDFSIIGTAHSHPSGALSPSTADLNNFYGRIMIIVAYPYGSERDIIVVDGRGKKLNYEVIDDYSGDPSEY
ncbi:Mov34/MPN/PAD-1 family protein [Candidatus Bathyarchaeota archaeon]|nr:Mov34/MPN/PAD-1 family protein [Candidatus Bathyarchaeota archaeon]